MNSKLLILALLVLISSGFAAPNVCKMGNIVNRPFTSTYSFPSNWNETHSAPHLAAGQSCSWVITIPQGYYAKLIIGGKINDTVGHFQTVDATGNINFGTQHENKEPWYFPTPKFTLIVNNEAPATLGFKVVWVPFPNINLYDAGVYMRPHVVNITKDIFGAEFSAGKASLLAFPADPKNHHTLRSVMVFQGQNANGTYLTNLWNIYNARTQFIGPNAVLYVVNLEASGVLDLLLVQDSEFTNDLNPYKELSCGVSSTCSKFLGGGTGKSGLVYVGNQNQTLTNIAMDQNATLSVYYGGQTWADLYQTYNGSSIQSMLPLTFSGGFVNQYIISSGKSTMTFTLSG